jgi:hypothetical protein
LEFLLFDRGKLASPKHARFSFRSEQPSVVWPGSENSSHSEPFLLMSYCDFLSVGSTELRLFCASFEGRGFFDGDKMFWSLTLLILKLFRVSLPNGEFPIGVPPAWLLLVRSLGVESSTGELDCLKYKLS